MPNSSGTPVPESEWLAFVASLPTEDPAARMRVLRSLDSLGCSVLREGVYLLPDTPAIRQGLARLSDQVALISGTSYVLCLSSIDHAQSRTFRSLFDRSAKYEELTKTVQGLTVGFGVSEPVAISRLLNKQRREFEAISALDFFPSEARERAAQALRQTEEQVRALMAPDPPKSTPVTQSGHFYLKRIWATRHPLRDDRLASAWLIRRFIDPEATLIWLERDQECPSTAIGFGFQQYRIQSHLRGIAGRVSIGEERDAGSNRRPGSLPGCRRARDRRSRRRRGPAPGGTPACQQRRRAAAGNRDSI